MESAKNSTLQRLNTLKQSISLNLTNKRDSGSAANCNSEFDFVSFDCDVACDLRRGLNGFDPKDEKLLPAVQTKRGVLWQISGKIFSTWKERFCVLTENSFYSFSKKSTSAAKTFRKIKLSDINDICILNERGLNTIILKMNNGGKFFFRKSEGLLEWYNQFLSNTSSHIRSNLRKSLSMNQLNNRNMSRRPLMGINSLTQSFYR